MKDSSELTGTWSDPSMKAAHINTHKFIAVYMDHFSANIMRFVNENIQTEIVVTEFNHHSKVEALHRSESIMHNKEQQLQLNYYNSIRSKLKESNNILLFGSTTAKMELLNILRNDIHFKAVIIVTSTTDKMSDNQQHAFIRRYMKTHLI